MWVIVGCHCLKRVDAGGFFKASELEEKDDPFALALLVLNIVGVVGYLRWQLTAYRKQAGESLSAPDQRAQQNYDTGQQLLQQERYPEAIQAFESGMQVQKISHSLAEQLSEARDIAAKAEAEQAAAEQASMQQLPQQQAAVEEHDPEVENGDPDGESPHEPGLEPGLEPKPTAADQTSTLNLPLSIARYSPQNAASPQQLDARPINENAGDPAQQASPLPLSAPTAELEPKPASIQALESGGNAVGPQNEPDLTSLVVAQMGPKGLPAAEEANIDTKQLTRELDDKASLKTKLAAQLPAVRSGEVPPEAVATSLCRLVSTQQGGADSSNQTHSLGETDPLITAGQSERVAVGDSDTGQQTRPDPWHGGPWSFGEIHKKIGEVAIGSHASSSDRSTIPTGKKSTGCCAAPRTACTAPMQTAAPKTPSKFTREQILQLLQDLFPEASLADCNDAIAEIDGQQNKSSDKTYYYRVHDLTHWLTSKKKMLWKNILVRCAPIYLLVYSACC